MRLIVEPMRVEDIPQVLEVDRESYTLPWPASAYRREILHNPNARYLVLRDSAAVDGSEQPEASNDRQRHTLSFLRWPLRASGHQGTRSGQTVGYAGMWIMVDEAHITTIAVRTAWRGRGLGELLLASLIAQAIELRVQRVTLEVRVSNDAAQSLYRKYGFHNVGTRRRYYSDNNEDAYIMTADGVQTAQYEQRFEELVERLRRRLARLPDTEINAPPLEWAAAEGADG